MRVTQDSRGAYVKTDDWAVLYAKFVGAMKTAGGYRIQIKKLEERISELQQKLRDNGIEP